MSNFLYNHLFIPKHLHDGLLLLSLLKKNHKEFCYVVKDYFYKIYIRVDISKVIFTFSLDNISGIGYILKGEHK